jgi:hypothetical protein
LDDIEWFPIDVVFDISCELIFPMLGPTGIPWPMKSVSFGESQTLLVNYAGADIDGSLAMGKLKVVGFEEWVSELIEDAENGLSSVSPQIPMVRFIYLFEVIMEAAGNGNAAPRLDTS